MAPLLAPSEQRFLLDGVDWMFYESLLERIGDRHVFITFDRGRLELMSPSWKHDTRSRRIAMLITIVADELDVPIQGGGSTTFRYEGPTKTAIPGGGSIKSWASKFPVMYGKSVA